MSDPIQEDLKERYARCCHPDDDAYSAWECTLIERIAALEAQVARLTHPRIYVGTYYANADVPERCPDCDGRDFISYGVTSLICKNCWLTAELDKAEAQVQQLREALDMMLSSAHPNERDHPAMFCAWKEARAALAATEEKA